jgi:ligand-binding sensor domain-containing protein
VAFVVAAAMSFAVSAQSQALRRDFYFRTIGTEQGLAQNTVSAFLQDRDGYLWIGTDSGLQQYDGYGFTTYAHASDDPVSLPEGPISSLAEDADGNLWIGTLGSGLVRHRKHSDAFERIGAFVNVHTLRADARSGLWVGCDQGIVLLDPSSGKVTQQWPLDSGSDHAVQLRQFDVESGSDVWAASSTGLLRLSRNGAAPVRVAATQISDARALSTGFDGRLRVATTDGLYVVDEKGAARRIWPDNGDQLVTAMVEDSRGRLWLAVQSVGLALFDPRSGETQWLRPDAGVPGSLPDAIVTSLQFDRSGLLWLGTHERGISKVDPAGTAFRYIADRDPSRRQTAANYIRAVFEDGSGDLWIGTPEGIKRYRRHDNRFDYFDDLATHGIKGEVDARDLTVYGFAQADAGRLWIGTERGAALFDPVRRTLDFLPVDPHGTHGLIDPNIRALLVASDGAVWLGSIRAGVARFDPRDGSWTHYQRDAGDGVIGGLSDNRVLALYEDREHRIWAGNINGLNLIDPVQRSVRVLRSDPQDARSLSATLVRSIHQGTDGHLWFGTQSGLNRLDSLDEHSARFSRWSVRDGLPGATVYAIRSDRMGGLWLSTNHGIASFDPSSGSFRGFALADGLQGMEFNGGVATTLASGEIVFGGVNGLNLFQPQTIVGSRYAAPIVLTSARVGARGLPAQRVGDALVMAAADRLIRFEFAALDFATPEHNRFAYQLEGFDEHWIEAGTRHDATYTNLDAGRYLFKVRASNRDGYWNEQVAQTQLDVTPAWWDSLAARSAYMLAGSCVLFVLWRGQRRRRNEERSHHLDLREREDRQHGAFPFLGAEDQDVPQHHVPEGEQQERTFLAFPETARDVAQRHGRVAVLPHIIELVPMVEEHHEQRDDDPHDRQ